LAAATVPLDRARRARLEYLHKRQWMGQGQNLDYADWMDYTDQFRSSLSIFPIIRLSGVVSDTLYYYLTVINAIENRKWEVIELLNSNVFGVDRI
jgi:hypothetical protein